MVYQFCCMALFHSQMRRHMIIGIYKFDVSQLCYSYLDSWFFFIKLKHMCNLVVHIFHTKSHWTNAIKCKKKLKKLSQKYLWGIICSKCVKLTGSYAIKVAKFQKQKPMCMHHIVPILKYVHWVCCTVFA